MSPDREQNKQNKKTEAIVERNIFKAVHPHAVATATSARTGSSALIQTTLKHRLATPSTRSRLRATV